MQSVGKNVTTEISDVECRNRRLREKIAVAGGMQDPRVLNPSGTVDELKILDSGGLPPGYAERLWRMSQKSPN